MVHSLGPCASSARGSGSVPGQGPKILHAMWRGQKKKKREMVRIFSSPELCLSKTSSIYNKYYKILS